MKDFPLNEKLRECDFGDFLSREIKKGIVSPGREKQKTTTIMIKTKYIKENSK